MFNRAAPYAIVISDSCIRWVSSVEAAAASNLRVSRLSEEFLLDEDFFPSATAEMTMNSNERILVASMA